MEQANGWDLRKNYVLVYRRVHTRFKGICSKIPDERASINGSKWNGSMFRYMSQIHASFPNLSERMLRRLCLARGPLRCEDEEVAKAAARATCSFLLYGERQADELISSSEGESQYKFCGLLSAL